MYPTFQFLLDVTLYPTSSISCTNNSDFAKVTALPKPRFKNSERVFL